MADSFFDSAVVMPNDIMVADVLADKLPLWEELYNHVQENYPNISGEWRYYNNSTGWHYKLISKKRNLFFFIPQNGYFRLGFIFGDKAASCIEVAELPEEIKEAVRIAKRYTSGRGFNIDISLYEQLDAVKRLLKIKFEN